MLISALALSLGLAASAAPRLEVGLGDRYDQVVAGKRVVVYKAAEKDGLRFKYVALWLTPGWKDWVTKDLLKKIAADGHVPLLLYYTFGDRASKEYLSAAEGARLKVWRKDIEENLAPAVDIASEVLIALEPEFNVIPSSGTPLTRWPEWDAEAAAAVDAIHKRAPLAKVGLCPGDWGNRDLAPALAEAVKKSDFIAFPEMRAATDPTRDTRSPAYRDAGAAAVDFSSYLKKAFGKPILFAYLTVSSYGGWDQTQAEIIDGVFAKEKQLLDNGVFAVSYFAYFDDPTHGVEFFGPAERSFGLKDANGRPKKAWRVWKKRTEP